MKTEDFCKESHPETTKKLRLPDQLELVMEDGTVYRVRSFFVAEQQVGDVPDSLLFGLSQAVLYFAERSFPL